MTAGHPTREAPWIDPETGMLVWREMDPVSGVVRWFWKDPVSLVVTELVDGDSIPFSKATSARGRRGPTREKIWERTMSEGVLRARIDEGYSIASAALLTAQRRTRYAPRMGLRDGERAGDPVLKNAEEAEKAAADIIRANHHQMFQKIAPEKIYDLIWIAAVRVFAVAQVEDCARNLPQVLNDVLTSFENEDRDTIERSADRVLDYARDLLRASDCDPS